MKKPLIGVVPLWDSEKESLWMLPGYMEGIAEGGGLPVVLPLAASNEDVERLANELGGFLFTGGQDVSPLLYGEKPLSVCGETCSARDSLELRLLKAILERDKPLLGICRGIQFINAALGGSLYQDLPSQRPSALVHCQNPPYAKPVHKVRVLSNTPLSRLLGSGELAVNSYHHQGVRETAPALSVCAEAEDGLVEGLYMKNKRFVLAVQWHPEFSFKTDESSRRIFSAFVSACKE